MAEMWNNTTTGKLPLKFEKKNYEVDIYIHSYWSIEIAFNWVIGWFWQLVSKLLPRAAPGFGRFYSDISTQSFTFRLKGLF